MTLIQLAGVDKSVRLPTGDMLQILHAVDLQIEQGEHVAIIGRSGSGKSTLLNVLGLLDNPSAGEYHLDGRNVGRLSGKQRSDLRGRTFGFVFQQFNLLPRRTAVDNAAVPLLYSRGETFWRRRALARHMLEQVGLGDRLDARPEQLSGGEQQRVAIARALVRQPKIILADEPTGSLDVDTGVVVMDLLERVCAERGATLITITHDLGVASRAGRRYRLEHGSIAHEDAALSETADRGTAGGARQPGAPDLHDTRPIEIPRGAADTIFLPPVPGAGTEQIPVSPEAPPAKAFPHHEPPDLDPLLTAPGEDDPRPAPGPERGVGQITPAVVVPPSVPEPPRPPSPPTPLRKSRRAAPWLPERTPAPPPPEPVPADGGPGSATPAEQPDGQRPAHRLAKPPRRRRILPARVTQPVEQPAEPRPPLDEELYRMGGEQE